MTALAIGESWTSEPNRWTSPAERAIQDSAWSMRPVSLHDLVECADLQTRVDQKYLVSAGTFRRMAAELDSRLRVLEIDGLRTFGYESVYFDTPQLLTYRAHIQGRRRRFKARTRTYTDSGLCMFEVKHKTPRGDTVKNRIPHPIDERAELTDEAQAHLARILREQYGQQVPDGLRAALTNIYRRTTFALLTEGARLTCDVSLSCHTDLAGVRDQGIDVLVESKSSGGSSTADQILRRLGVRPISISKYCLGIAALNPRLPSNPWARTLRRYFEPPSPHAAGLARVEGPGAHLAASRDRQAVISPRKS